MRDLTVHYAGSHRQQFAVRAPDGTAISQQSLPPAGIRVLGAPVLRADDMLAVGHGGHAVGVLEDSQPPRVLATLPLEMTLSVPAPGDGALHVSVDGKPVQARTGAPLLVGPHSGRLRVAYEAGRAPVFMEETSAR